MGLVFSLKKVDNTEELSRPSEICFPAFQYPVKVNNEAHEALTNQIAASAQ